MEFEEGDNVLCTVKRISGTAVFVHIEDNGEGTIVTSEIAPGRIHNLRDYVVPGKKIICKILRIDKSGNMHLSLRRVTDKEKREVIQKYDKERSAVSIIKSVAKEKAGEITEKIKEEHEGIYDFLQSCKESPENLERYFSEDEVKKICKILEEKKEKKVEVKKEFSLSSKKPNGLLVIKSILKPYENIIYLAANKFMVKVKSENYKKANHEAQKILGEIEERAEKEDAKFSMKEK